MNARAVNPNRVRLGDIAKVVSGYAFKSNDFMTAGIPVIKIKNIRVGYVDLSEIDYIDPSFLTLPEKYHVRGGDLLISLTGSHLSQPNSVVGRVALHSSSLGNCLLNQRAGKIILKNPDASDLAYLFYVLYTQEKRREIALMAAGAASQANVSPTQVESIEINLPPLETQRKIASILSTYDDLIGNNTRRIKILEEMARMIYREWFVNFRFPGHEKVKLVNSSLGKIPEGWEVKTLGEVCSVIKRGISPRYDEGSWSTVINQKCIRDFRLNLKDSRKHNTKVPAEKYIFQGDVLINSTGVGTLGRVAQVLQDTKDCTADSHVTIVRPSDAINTDVFGLQMFEMQGHFESLGQGATGQTELGREAIANSDIIIASTDIQEKFSATVKAMRCLAKRLAEKNRNLCQTRDLLLPKLIFNANNIK